MNRPVPHREFIRQKYLSKVKEDDYSKKKRYKSATGTKNIRIHDDDLDLKKINANELGSDDELYYGTKEEKPIIAAIIDERPLHMKRKDMTSRWVTVSQPDNEPNQDLAVENSNDNSSDKHSHCSSNLKGRSVDEDNDLSPPRSNYRQSSPSTTKEITLTTTANNADLSPPRKHQKIKKEDVDLSPPRPSSTKRCSSSHKDNSRSFQMRERTHRDESRHKSSLSKREDERYSPPRKSRTYVRSPVREREENDRRHSDKSPRTANDRLSEPKKKQGLCDVNTVREEAEKMKKLEKELMSSKDAATLGKGAKTIYRDSTGKIRDLEEEKQEAEKKSKVDDEKTAKYKEWNMGLKQKEEQKTKAEDALHEMSKPLARYEDDADLDKLLREKEQDDDPMLQYMRKKKAKERIKEADKKGEKVYEKPRYNGPTPAPLNRYGIEPGYRWDGVDRSNGFERDLYARIAEKSAIQEEAYRWSTEDM